MAANGSMTPKEAFNMGSPLTDIETCEMSGSTYIVVGAEGPNGKKGFGEVHILKVESDMSVSRVGDPISVGARAALHMSMSVHCVALFVGSQSKGRM